MELDKEDIEAVANNRFFRKRIKHLVALIIGVLAVFVLGVATQNIAIDIICTISFAGGLIYLMRLAQHQSRYRKSLVNEWLQSKNSKSI